MKVLLSVFVALLVVGSVHAAVIFSDNFETGLTQWTVATTGSGSVSLQPRGAGGSFCYMEGLWENEAKITSNANFTSNGTYVLEFDLFHYIRDNNDGWRGGVSMPGGLRMAWKGWGNGYVVTYKGSVVSDHWGDAAADSWAHYVMVQDGLNASFSRNGTVIYSGTVDSAPDFTNFSQVSINIRGDQPGLVGVDNLTLDYVPEPASLLLGMAAFAGLLRRSRSKVC